MNKQKNQVALKTFGCSHVFLINARRVHLCAMSSRNILRTFWCVYWGLSGPLAMWIVIHCVNGVYRASTYFISLLWQILSIYLIYSVGIDAAELNIDWNGEQQGQLHAASVRLERMGLHRVCVPVGTSIFYKFNIFTPENVFTSLALIDSIFYTLVQFFYTHAIFLLAYVILLRVQRFKASNFFTLVQLFSVKRFQIF